jgi:hypothetical protein
MEERLARTKEDDNEEKIAAIILMASSTTSVSLKKILFATTTIKMVATLLLAKKCQTAIKKGNRCFFLVYLLGYFVNYPLKIAKVVQEKLYY